MFFVAHKEYNRSVQGSPTASKNIVACCRLRYSARQSPCLLSGALQKQLLTVFLSLTLMVRQNKKTNFGSSFYLSKTEGLGMASIRIANCMELRLVRAWHQPTGCILHFPSFLIPYNASH